MPQFEARDLRSPGELRVVGLNDDPSPVFGLTNVDAAQRHGEPVRGLAGDRQHGGCGFTTKGVLPYPEDLMPPRAGDFDGDGRPDLVFGHRLSGSRSGKIYFLESAP